MPYAIIGNQDVPLLYLEEWDCFGIGKSHCPFPICEGTHEVDFLIEDTSFTFEVKKIYVTFITRRHVYFELEQDNEHSLSHAEGSESEESQLSSSAASENSEEILPELEDVDSLWDSSHSWQ